MITNKEYGGMWRKNGSGSIMRYYHCACLEGLNITTNESLRMVIHWLGLVSLSRQEMFLTKEQRTGTCNPTEFFVYVGGYKSFRTGRLERELQMVQLSATRCSCIAIL